MPAEAVIWLVIGSMMALGVAFSILGIRWAGRYTAHGPYGGPHSSAVHQAPDEADLHDLRAATTAADVLAARK